MRYEKYPPSFNAPFKAGAAMQRQRGFTLLEVLIALIIFLLGLLASAGLMLSSMRSVQFSGQSVVGTSFTREYGELMQLIPSAASSTYNATTTGALSFRFDTSDAGSHAADCTGDDKACSPQAIMAAMKDDWGKRVQSQLPGGRAVVCRDTTAADANGNYNWTDCNGSGEQMRVKLGWHSKKMSDSNSGTSDQGWMTDDHPRMVVTIMGNLKDYATQTP